MFNFFKEKPVEVAKAVEDKTFSIQTATKQVDTEDPDKFNIMIGPVKVAELVKKDGVWKFVPKQIRDPYGNLTIKTGPTYHVHEFTLEETQAIETKLHELQHKNG